MLKESKTEIVSIKTLSDDKLYTESLKSNEQLENTQLLEGNAISPIVLDDEQLKKNMVNVFAIQKIKRSKTPPH